MALKDLLAWADNKLESIFHSVPHDPAKARKPVLAGIARTEEQWDAVPPSKAPNKWAKQANGIVSFSPKLGGNPLLINGQSTLFLPAEHFPKFLKGLRVAVEEGELDQAILEAQAGTSSSPTATASTRVKRPMSDETRWKLTVAQGRRHGKSDEFITKSLKEKGATTAAIPTLLKG
jgi:hypothetical protein